MSYILDALNKAEQARNQGDNHAQTIPVIHAAEPQKNSHKLLTTILILTFGAIIFWLNFDVPKPAPVIAKNNTSALLPIKVQQPDIIPAPQVTQVPNSVVKTTSDPEPIPTTKAIPSIMNLPQHIRDSLPNINISAHVHSEGAAKRMVIINGKVLREQGYITEHLTLRAITKQGVELEFNGSPFSMKALDSWPF